MHGVGRPSSTRRRTGELTGLFLLGWGADFPDPINFLDYHFNARTTCSSARSTHRSPSRSRPPRRPSTRPPARRPTPEANNAIKAFVPMVPIAHGASAAAYLADVDGRPGIATDQRMVRDHGSGRGVTRSCWMQNAEPISLYCGDETDGETLRICEQINEPLYQYEVSGVDPEPALATGCDPNNDGTVWTCKLREGVTFHDGAAFDANDVVVSFALQWDANTRSTSGARACSSTGAACGEPTSTRRRRARELAGTGPVARAPPHGRRSRSTTAEQPLHSADAALRPSTAPAQHPRALRHHLRRLRPRPASFPATRASSPWASVPPRRAVPIPASATASTSRSPSSSASTCPTSSKGDLGTSIRFGRPVSEMLIERMPVTLELTLLALLFAVVAGDPARRAGGVETQLGLRRGRR